MALWKPFLGNRTSLDNIEKHAGYVYWCADDGSLHFDYVDAEGTLQRKQINAKDAETLGLHSADEFILKSELLQSDWNQTDSTKIDYIKNKPENLATIEYVMSMASNPTFIATLLANMPAAEEASF